MINDQSFSLQNCEAVDLSVSSSLLSMLGALMRLTLELVVTAAKLLALLLAPMFLVPVVTEVTGSLAPGSPLRVTLVTLLCCLSSEPRASSSPEILII